MMATELGLIERALWLMDPEAMSRHHATQKTLEVRGASGICTADLGCETPAVRDGACEVHARELDDFILETEREEGQ